MKPRALHGRLDALARQHEQAMTETPVEVHLPTNGRDLERPEDEIRSLPPWAPHVVLYELDEKSERRRDPGEPLVPPTTEGDESDR